MESALTMSFQYEPLFTLYLKKLNTEDLKETLPGLFQDGVPSIIHLGAFIKTHEGVAVLMDIIEKDESLLF
jgi:hypothetical protein